LLRYSGVSVSFKQAGRPASNGSADAEQWANHGRWLLYSNQMDSSGGKKSPGHPIAGTLNPCPDIAEATGQNGLNLKEFDPF